MTTPGRHRFRRRLTDCHSAVLAAALLTVLAILPAAAAEPSAIQADCGSPLPQVLDVALPYAPGADVGAAERSLRRITGAWYRRAARCPDRPLQVNVAFGSDYQILDWLDRGEVDVGVVSILALHLLERDAVDLRPVPLPPTAGSLLSLPGLGERAARFRASPFSGTATGYGEAEWDEAARRRFEALLEECWQAAVAEEDAADPRAHHRPRSSLRLVSPSHLSSVGFLVPVGEAESWLRPRLDRHAGTERGAERERQRVDDRFWQALFARTCFHFGDDRGAEEPVCPRLAGPGVRAKFEIEVVAAPVAGAAGVEGRAEHLIVPAPAAYATDRRQGFRDRMVIHRAALETIFEPATADAAEPLPRLPPHLGRLFGRAAAGPPGSIAPVPAPFRSHLQPEPYYDTRTFAFTLDETMRLLDLNQRTSGRSQLALVLPGGGVKAAYQSKLLDRLYGDGRLQNYRLRAAANSTAGGDGGPLDVVYVIGTSGGALVGYFVARLGAQGPHDLSSILWLKEPEAGETRGELIDSGDIFPFNDLPRYLSLVAILFVLLSLVAVASLRENGWLSPDRRGADAAPALPRSSRPSLLVPLVSVVAATPFLVRLVNGEASLEHVPEFEGLLYAVLLVVAMFADHCVVYGRREEREEKLADTWVSPTLLVVLGLALLALPALVHWLPGLEELLAEDVTTGVAAYVLGLPIAGFALGVTRRAGAERLRREPFYWLAGFLAGLAGSWLVLRLFGAIGLLHRFDQVPLIFFGLFAVLTFILIQRRVRAWHEQRAARQADAAPDWIDRALASRAVHRGLEWSEHPVARRLLSLLPLVGACLLILDFTRPQAALFAATPLYRLPFVASRLATPLGGFAVCTGALLVVVGLVLHLHRQPNHYTLRDVRRFVDATLLLILGFAAAVYVALFAASRIPWFKITLFELTVSFWKGLLVISLLFALALLAWARWAGERNRVSRWLNGSLRFLGSRHPNARLVGRRFLRLALLAIGGLAWWNLLLAPGFYGNKFARQYLVDAAARFDRQFTAVHGDAPSRLTARLLTPANALEVDGTRYILAVPGEEPCPTVRQAPGSGSVWHRFRVVDDHTAVDPSDPCRAVPLGRGGGRNGDGLNLLEAAVFASGSPFPIFPAHRIGFERGGPKEALVDGGYTNLVPIDAATDVGAEQVLILNSSYPLPDDGGEAADPPTGPLVDNFLRLPGFLYERAQQIDRRSRAGLFVVSLSPLPRDGWPILTDFRSDVVEEMWRAAEQDFDERIGMVESWGPPRFQLSLRVEGRALEATPAGPPAPGRAPSR